MHFELCSLHLNSLSHDTLQRHQEIWHNKQEFFFYSSI